MPLSSRSSLCSLRSRLAPDVSSNAFASSWACLLERFDSTEAWFFDVEAGLDLAGNGVVDGAGVAEPVERLASAVEHGEAEPGVLLLPGQRVLLGELDGWPALALPLLVSAVDHRFECLGLAVSRRW